MNKQTITIESLDDLDAAINVLSNLKMSLELDIEEHDGKIRKYANKLLKTLSKTEKRPIKTVTMYVENNEVVSLSTTWTEP